MPAKPRKAEGPAPARKPAKRAGEGKAVASSVPKATVPAVVPAPTPLILNPTAKAALHRELIKAQCERSLLAFVKRFWHVLEPGRTMVDGWALRAICDHLEAVERGDIKRLLMNCQTAFKRDPGSACKRDPGNS